MGQIFRPQTVLGVKLAILGSGMLVVLGIVSMNYYNRNPGAVAGGPPQPIPFSHKHHVGDDGIDCRYCHQGAENGALAGIPGTDVCMSCHSQLFTDAPALKPVRDSARTGRRLVWTRVHDLPDFVYFNHSIHISKGVACIECHGRVDLMPIVRQKATLQMQWCLECHREPGPHLRPVEQVFEMTASSGMGGEHRTTGGGAPKLSSLLRRIDCSTCHR